MLAHRKTTRAMPAAATARAADPATARPVFAVLAWPACVASCLGAAPRRPDQHGASHLFRFAAWRANRQLRFSAHAQPAPRRPLLLVLPRVLRVSAMCASVPNSSATMIAAASHVLAGTLTRRYEGAPWQSRGISGARRAATLCIAP